MSNAGRTITEFQQRCLDQFSFNRLNAAIVADIIDDDGSPHDPSFGVTQNFQCLRLFRERPAVLKTMNNRLLLNLAAVLVVLVDFHLGKVQEFAGLNDLGMRRLEMASRRMRYRNHELQRLPRRYKAVRTGIGKVAGWQPELLVDMIEELLAVLEQVRGYYDE